MFSLFLYGQRCAYLFTVLAVYTASLMASPSASATPLSPASAVHAALQVHPQAREAEAALLLARGERSASLLLLNNPELSAESSIHGARQGLSASQPLSLSGEGWFARRAARANVEASEAALSRIRLVVSAQVRQHYVEAVVAVGTTSIAKRGLALSSRLREAATRQHEVGETSQLDVRLARLAETRAAADVLQARATEVEALRTLAASIGEPVMSTRLLLNPLAAAPIPGALSTTERTDVVAARSRLQATEVELNRQRAASLPPLGLGVFADVEDGATFIGPSVSLQVPLFNRNQSGRALAKGTLQVQQARLASVIARAETERITAAQRMAEAQALSSALLDEPSTQAKSALNSIEVGYRAGELDLSTAILLQREVLDGESASIALLGQLAAARLDLLLATEDPSLLGDEP